jgi:hypothetical protein
LKNKKMHYDYEWDPQKARTNLIKRGVVFAVGVMALEDKQALTLEDDHPGEQRFVTPGADAFGRILVVVYTYLATTIRIISARKATPMERSWYLEDKK